MLRVGLFFGVAAALGHIARATNMVDLIDWGRQGMSHDNLVETGISWR